MFIFDDLLFEMIMGVRGNGNFVCFFNNKIMYNLCW